MKTLYLIELNRMKAYIWLYRSIHSSIQRSLKMSHQLRTTDKFTPWERVQGTSSIGGWLNLEMFWILGNPLHPFCSQCSMAYTVLMYIVTIICITSKQIFYSI